MSKETKNSMAVRQHMEAASNAVDKYYKEDTEHRAVLQLLVENSEEDEAGSTGCNCMGYGHLIATGVDNALDNCEGFRAAVVTAVARRSPLLGMLLAKILSNSNEEEE